MVEILQARAAVTPDERAFTFLLDGEEEGPRLTYGELDCQARTVAAALQDVAGPGDRALLMFAPGLEFIPAFFGCQYAGVVPVPAYPPRFDRLVQSWQALANIVSDCGPKAVLTTRNLTAMFGGTAAVPQLAGLRWVCTDALDASAGRGWREPALTPGSLALLQYTSGSTALPRGVAITHRNLIHNQRILRAADTLSGPGPGVSWLPLYHDMGLLGVVVQTVFRGTLCVLMSPLGILQKPYRWLRAISRYRARISGGPNFAYELCADRVTDEQKAALDLSEWRVAILAGEPINPRTLDRFAAAFAPCGFRREAFSPCYGLAEATLMVAGRRPALPFVRSVNAAALEEGHVVSAEPGAPGARPFVSCGGPWLDTRIVIARPETMTRCPPDSVGEIWVAGLSVADGYWGRSEETERTFRARLGDTGEGPFLRTGDLGFFEGGELFVTGRLKELLIIHGRNHYPQDIEQTVQEVNPGLRAGCGAAFEAYKDGESLLVVVQEVERRCRHLDVARLIGDVRLAVAERHGLHVHDLRLLDYGSLPKTSSGKVQRHLCRLGYEQESLKAWKGATA
jgi:acyl-CoA synthetase (AMP-forming)/AMP-acid ligase II